MPKIHGFINSTYIEEQDEINAVVPDISIDTLKAAIMWQTFDEHVPLAFRLRSWHEIPPRPDTKESRLICFTFYWEDVHVGTQFLYGHLRVSEE